MRDGYTRTREIEQAAVGLVAWFNEFVGDAQDHKGMRIYMDLREQVDTLAQALQPLKDENNHAP